jgi:hypothetical protein
MTPDLPYAARLADACRAVRDTEPVPPSWPHTGRSWPRARWVSAIRAAGWPLVEATKPVGNPARTARPVQPVVLVPESWLRELAILMGVPWEHAHREFT